MNYFLVAFLVVGASLLCTQKLQYLTDKIFSNFSFRGIIWISTIIFLITSAMGVYKYNSMQMGLWDFGIYDSIMYQMLNGGKFMHDFRGGAYDHFSPVILLMLPFYAICDTPYILIVIQALVMAAAGPILYYLVKKYFPTGPLPFLLTIAYFLNPYYSRLVYYDFHSETLYPLVVFSAFLLRAKGKNIWFMLLLIATPMIKEDFVIPLGALGLYFLFCKNQRKMGVLFLVSAILWTLFVLKIYFPAMNDGGYSHYNRYELSGENILVMVEKTFSLPALAVLISIILPFAFMPLVHWKFFILVVMPTLGVQLVSGAPDQNWLKSHYASAIIAIVPIATLWGFRAMRRNKFYEKKLYLFLFIISTLGHLFFCEIAQARFYTFVENYIVQNHITVIGLPITPYAFNSLAKFQKNADELIEITEKIPKDSTVMSQNELGCHLLRTHKVSSMAEYTDADFLLFSKDNFSGFGGFDILNSILEEKLSNPNYHIWAKEKGIIVISNKKFIPLPERAIKK